MKQAAAATAAEGGFGRNTFFNVVRNAYLEAERGDGTETPASRKAREDHEQIVSHVASDIIPKLDRLQARTLHGAPFGHRCARNNYASYAANDENEGEEDDEDADKEGGEEEEKDGEEGPATPAGSSPLLT